MPPLPDIRDVKINPSLPIAERKAEFLRQIGDPYHYKCGKINVTISYAGTETLEHKIISLLKNNASYRAN
jgi:hypothetical protein